MRDTLESEAELEVARKYLPSSSIGFKSVDSAMGRFSDDAARVLFGRCKGMVENPSALRCCAVLGTLCVVYGSAVCEPVRRLDLLTGKVVSMDENLTDLRPAGSFGDPCDGDSVSVINIVGL